MAGSAVEELVIPWSATQAYSQALSGFSVFPLNPFYAVPFLVLLIPMFMDSVPVGSKVLAGLVLVGWAVLCVWRVRAVLARPAYQEKAAVSRMLSESREHAQAYACLQGACDEMKWYTEQKTLDPDGKPLLRRIYPAAEFIVEMEAVRRVRAWVPDPRFPLVPAPTLGEEVRLRFDTTQVAMDSEKLRKGVEVLRSKLGLNGYVSEIDLSRGETRHVDVCFRRTARSGNVF
jgi:hypothetical protein